MRLLFKSLMVFGMTLLILIPLLMIRGTIHERQGYRNEAVASVVRSSAGAQTLAGPVLVVPYEQWVEVQEKDDKGKVARRMERQSGRWTFFPERLAVDGTLLPDTRRLGLHEVRVYELQAVADAKFDAEFPADAPGAQPRTIGRPWLSWGIADVRGLGGMPAVRVAGHERRLDEGFGSREGGGVHVRLDAPKAGETLRLDARLQLKLGGTESLSLVPLARSNRFSIDSAWPHPRFEGDFLPKKPRIDGRGFAADWEISSLASSAQGEFLAGQGVESPAERNGLPEGSIAAEPMDAATISLVDPVNVYSQADRATKYGLLFVLLTFVGFFMLELIKQLPVHPLQYLLVGLALAIFFLLLVSLSEHIAFHWAYLIASVACIGLIGFYLSAVLRSVARGVGFAAMLATLYGALYGLLVSEDNALVLGSALLFVILAAIMAATRKIDWYQLSSMRPAQTPLR